MTASRQERHKARAAQAGREVKIREALADGAELVKSDRRCGDYLHWPENGRTLCLRCNEVWYPPTDDGPFGI